MNETRRYLSQMSKICLKKKWKDFGHCKHEQYSEQEKKETVSISTFRTL